MLHGDLAFASTLSARLHRPAARGARASVGIPHASIRRARTALATVLLAALVACGGGGSGEGSGDSSGSASNPTPGAGTPPAAAPPPVPVSTRTLGGTVSGLGAEGLTLANGDATLAVASGATGFTFPTGLATGTAYAVTIRAAPTSHDCRVENGTGTVGNADVVDVAVRCELRRHSLGGTVSGLTAGRVVIANGAATLAVDAGTTRFAFADAIATGSSYAVGVQSNPAGLTCSIANGTGTIGNADVDNVVVTCASQAYTLGGTITGLRSAGLVLANGSDQLVVASGDTTFTLPTAVAWASGYSVTIVAQPAGSSCAVTRGTGTMPAAPATDVLVTCSDQPYRLGGSVSGLNSTGLVIGNGSDLLALAPGVTQFTMPASLYFGSAYSVTVRSPAIGLVCSIAGGSGTMPAANVNPVAVTCAPIGYPLSGTISGLTVNGLVLANGSETLAVPANATQFTMPTPVAFGGGYAVTVQTQPATRTCSVANGSGTMGAASVTNVAVTCAASVFTVGGTISGLDAAGLVLENGSDTLAVAANATQFTMPNAGAAGASFQVRVRTQPTGKLCTVSNGSGTLAGSDVTNVDVVCSSGVISFATAGAATWTVPEGVTRLQVVARGGGGGTGTGSTNVARGGHGGVVTATLTVTPGDVLNLFVGGGGQRSIGGGGGGSSNVNAGSATQIIAGGGGGGGGNHGSGPGHGGNGGGSGTGAGQAGQSCLAPGGAGGAGGLGGATVMAGGNGNGGAGGGSALNAATAGLGSGTGIGAVAENRVNNGGGGGGGYGGGGAGGSTGSLGGGGGGGGGGSTGPAGSTFALGTNGGVYGVNGSRGGDGSIELTVNP
jgi:hypothetical protein